MTEKRFTLTERKCYFTSLILDNQKNKKMGSDKVVDLLNTLHEEKEDLATKKEGAEYELLHLKEKYEELLKENEQLKKDATTLICSNQEYRKENEQLKRVLQNTSDQRDEFYRGARENANRVGKMEKENEQLKQKNQLLYEDIDFLKRFIEKHGFKAKLASDKR